MKPSNPWLTAARYHPDLYECLAANDDCEEIPAGAAIAQQYGPLLGKIIMVLCALYALELSVMG